MLQVAVKIKSKKSQKEPDQSKQEPGEYEEVVKEIIGHKVNKDGDPYLYHVVWGGFGPEKTSWLTEESFIDREKHVINEHFKKYLENLQFYIVDFILDQRGRGDNLEYKIRWLGYTAKEDSWEPFQHVDPECVSEYKNKKKKKTEEIRKNNVSKSVIKQINHFPKRFKNVQFILIVLQSILTIISHVATP